MTFLEELRTDFQTMIKYREAVQYATATYKSMITPFIDYCGENYPYAVSISREMVDGWLQKYNYSKQYSGYLYCVSATVYQVYSFPWKTCFCP